MKNKHLILGLVALTLAMGSAFTTITEDLQPAFIEVQYQQNGDWECVDTEMFCDNAAGSVCNISITTPGGGSEVITGKLNDLSCNTALKHTTASAQNVTITGAYDAR